MVVEGIGVWKVQKWCPDVSELNRRSAQGRTGEVKLSLWKLCEAAKCPVRETGRGF